MGSVFTFTLHGLDSLPEKVHWFRQNYWAELTSCNLYLDVLFM